MSPPAAERPRDRLGRPLARGAVGFPPAPPRTEISAGEASAEARAYLADGLPFHAHEVLEMRWRCCPDDERELWRALAQAAAGATHAARGNPIGEQRLMTRAAAAIEAYAGPNPIDITQLLADLGLRSPA